MLVAIGPCRISSSTGSAIAPKVESTMSDGSVPPPPEATIAPSAASQTVGTNIASPLVQNTLRSLMSSRVKRE